MAKISIFKLYFCYLFDLCNCTFYLSWPFFFHQNSLVLSCGRYLQNLCSYSCKGYYVIYTFKYQTSYQKLTEFDILHQYFNAVPGTFPPFFVIIQYLTTCYVCLGFWSNWDTGVSDWCCSILKAWVLIPWTESQKIAKKNLVGFNFQVYFSLYALSSCLQAVRAIFFILPRQMSVFTNYQSDWTLSTCDLWSGKVLCWCCSIGYWC